MGTGMDAAHRADSVLAATAGRPRLSHVWVLLLLLLLSLALNYADLSGGFVLDDIVGVDFLRQHVTPQASWLRLWSASTDGATMYQQFWWADPGARLTFFRPLPSLLTLVCDRASGENARILHLLLILLHGLAAFTTFLLFASLTGDRRTALVSGLLFAASGRVTTVGWISAIPDVPCVAFINLALIAHLRWRRTDRPVLLVATLVSLLLALACKESAAVAPLAVVALEWTLGRSQGAPLASVVRRAGPSLAVLVVFAATYRLLHLGESDNLLYLSPFVHPGLYLRNAIIAVPVLLASALTVLHARPLNAPTTALVGRVVAGSGASLLLLWALRALWRETAVRWAVACFALLLLPQAATEPQDRLLYCPFVPLSFLLARLIATVLPSHAGEPAGPDATLLRASPRAAPAFTRAWGIYALFGLILPALVLSLRSARPRLAGLREPERRIEASLGVVRAALHRQPDTTVVILNTGGPSPDIYAGASYEYRLHRAVPTRVLAGLDRQLTLSRTGERSFTMSTDQRGWLGNEMSRLFRRDLPLFAGRVYATSLFDAELLRVTPDGQDALTVAFRFHRRLDDRRLLFLSWNGHDIVPFDLAKIGMYRPVPLGFPSAPVSRPPGSGA